MTTNVLHELADKWLPLPVEKFFRLPGEGGPLPAMPPTMLDALLSPVVTQSKLMAKYSILQQLNIGAQREAMKQELARRQHATARVGKRVKASRH